MKTAIRLSSALALSAVLVALLGCGKSQEETDAETQAVAESAAQQAVAQSEKKQQDTLASTFAEAQKQTEQQIADVKADMQTKLDTEKVKMQQELQAQVAEIKSQYAASNQAIKSQLASLTSKYESVKNKLPENINTTLQTKLPELKSSVSNLEALVSKFSPNSMEQLKEFQTKYETELGVAKKVADEILKLMGKGTLDSYMPKL